MYYSCQGNNQCHDQIRFLYQILNDYIFKSWKILFFIKQKSFQLNHIKRLISKRRRLATKIEAKSLIFIDSY